MPLRHVCVLLILGAVLSVPAWGHEGSHFVTGTVTATELDRLVIKAPDGKTVSLSLTPETRYRPSGDKTGATPKIGDRVVVRFSDVQGNGLQANEVRFSTVAPQPAP